jgi:hypothetical protein
MDEREIEAVAEVLAWEFGISERPSQRIIDASAKAVAALDRVRVARGDDVSAKARTLCPRSGCPLRRIEDRGPNEPFCVECGSSIVGERAARSPQGEDHEAGKAWDERVSAIVDQAHAEDWGGKHRTGFCEACADAYIVAQHAVPGAPSRVGSVAVEDVELRERIADELVHNDECGPGPVSRQEYLDDAAVILRIVAEFSRSSTDRPEQPEPDALGSQPPAEPETTGGASDA